MRVPIDRRSTGQGSQFLEPGQFVLYLGACLALAGVWIININSGQVKLLIVGAIVICCMGLASGVVRGFRPVVTVFFLFHLCWYVLPSAYQISVRRGAWGDMSVFNDPAVTGTALGVVSLGLFSMLLGYLYGLRRTEIKVGASSAARHLSTRKIVFVGLAASALLPLVISVSGGIGGLFVSRVAAAEQLARAGLSLQEAGGGAFGLLRIVPGALALVFLLLVLQRIRDDRRDRLAFRSRGFAVWAAILVTLYLNPFANTRYAVVTAIGAALLVWLAPRGSRAGPLAVAVGSAGLLFAYPLANIFRYTTRSSENQLSFGLDSLITPDFDGVQQSVNSVAFVSRYGHTWGDQLVSALLLVVPRSVWPGKAEPTNVLVARDRGYLFTNLSIPVESELYIDLGLIGVIVSMGIWGLLAARLDRDWLTGSGSPTVTAFVAFAQVGLIRGPLSGAIGFAGLGLAVLIWASWSSTGGPRPRLGAMTRARASSAQVAE